MNLRLPERLPIGAEIPFPTLVEVTQVFPRPRVADVRVAVRNGLSEILPDVRGRRIAITAGSRGIRDIVVALQGAVDALRAGGAEPVVVSAMGSHGGGTPEGQRNVLKHLGVTVEAVGAPLLIGSDFVTAGTTQSGLTLYLDSHAAACDGILVLNRVKPHTVFREPFGSGLMKMMAIGLGKAPGAAQIHRLGAPGFPAAIREVADAHIRSGRIIAGVAIIENAYDETAAVEVLAPQDIPARELVLFEMARRWMPSLPVDDLDVLVVDEMGKIYSGTGIDVNIIGRWRQPDTDEPPAPRIRHIVTLRLAPESDGNGQGVGLADVITHRLAAGIDFTATYLNAVTSTYIQRAFLPVIAPTDRAAIDVAVRALGLVTPQRVRMMRIANTLHLERLWVSESLLPEVRSRPNVTVGDPRPWAFGDDGDLRDLR